jgi:retron-type reverse transcriptase
MRWMRSASGSTASKVSFILDADIQSFFDTVNQEWLIRFVEHRIGDRRITRLIRKWLKAGVMENGVVTVSERGTGQGAVISPLLANIYLHYVLDLWAVRWRQREATGDMIIVRYADDFIIGFQHESDARRFLDEMRERLQKFALTLHPEKLGSSSSDALRKNAASEAGSASRRPSTSWASPSSAERPDRANSRSNGRAGGTACRRSSR